jgi:hypothetical protein
MNKLTDDRYETRRRDNGEQARHERKVLMWLGALTRTATLIQSATARSAMKLASLTRHMNLENPATQPHPRKRFTMDLYAELMALFVIMLPPVWL